MHIKSFLKLGILFTGLLFMASVNAGTIAQCGATSCSQSFTISADGTQWGTGQLVYDAKTGEISLDTTNVKGNANVDSTGAITWNVGSGNTATVSSLFGNADPILGFSLSASTGASGATFAFAFDLPIAISGPIITKASTNYSLTSVSGPGAEIKGIGGNKIVQSWDVDTTFGGIGSLNKNVDVGDDYLHFGSPVTSGSPVYTATSSIVGDLAYDSYVYTSRIFINC